MRNNNTILRRFLVAAPALLMLILLLCHTYNDIVITTRHGINFWHILFDGKLLEFFQVNVTVSGNDFYPAVQDCAYNILIYVVFAVWNFPLYLLELLQVTDVMNNVACLVYSKLMVVFAMLLTAKLLRDILGLLGVEKNKSDFLVYLYLTSSAMISIVFITSQYDVLSSVFILLGVKAFLEQKDKAFVLWFGIAICFKYFAALVFLPLLVLRYKKIWDWIKSLALVVCPWVLSTLPFIFYPRVSEDNIEMRLIKMILDDSSFEVNLFAVVYVVLIAWCYLQDVSADLGKRGHVAAWAGLIALLSFFGLLNIHPYWTVMLLPFVTLAMAYTGRHLYLSLLLETAGMACHVMDNMIDFNWCYMGDTMKSMLPSLFFETVPNCDGRLYYLLESFENEHSVAVLNSVFVASLAILAFFSFPGNKKATLAEKRQDCADILVLRVLSTAAICLLPLLSLFI